MPDARYYREHREELLAASRAWKRANRDRARTHNRETARRAAIREKAVARRRDRGRSWYAEHREQERSRARQFRQEHPEKVREYQARFRERHPERAAEQNKRGTEKWRDTNAEAVRAKSRSDAAQKREKDPEAFRRWYEANLEQQRARGREASRLRSRLKQLKLPPRKIQRVYANERRANDRAGLEFFNRPRTAHEVSRVRKEAQVTLPTAVLHARRRIMNRQELSAAGQQLQDRLRAAKARDLARAFFPEVASRVTAKRSETLRAQVEMDSVARQVRGREPYDVDAELQRRIQQEATAEVVALAMRSPDEEQMAKLLRASYPDKPQLTRSSAEAPRRQTPSSSYGRASAGIER